MIHLKTKTDFDKMEFGILVEPNIEVGQIRSDTELYQAIANKGKAIIHEFEAGSYRLKAKPITLSPSEFEQRWQGD